KPPNPRRGTSCKRRQTSPLSHTQLLLATFKGGMWWRKKRGVAITRGRQDEGMIFG
ncbi:hypothetical protein HMPREF9078_00279, partial [Capnocytophaga sp. oral taxon 380 str. F0488]